MKTVISSAALSLTLLLSNMSKADDFPEHIADRTNYPRERAIVFGANAGIGAILGCLGAQISGDGCLEGLWRGSIGGTITYFGMEIGSRNEQVPFSGLVGRGINDLGASIVSNAIFSRGFLERYETTFGPLVFSIDNNYGFRTYIQPLATGTVIYHFIVGHDFSLMDSIEDGTLVFRMYEPSVSRTGSASAGTTNSTIPAYMSSQPATRSHENIHTYQLSRMRWADELVPQVWIFRYGAEALSALLSLPANLFEGDAYYYDPFEMEAYAMERPGH